VGLVTDDAALRQAFGDRLASSVLWDPPGWATPLPRQAPEPVER
jgi:hypothetical protein